ncbi:MAG: nucleotidyltransferase family protein [Candidatus Nanoarchaeia archaeon]|nr:nucleotidyltransferase family protein [Candidatus Nanoarchaeia archaeon]
MVYTEIKKRNENIYFYSVLSIRKNNKISKKRIYLGKNLNKQELLLKEQEANKSFNLIRRNEALEKLKPKIINILKKYKIKKAGIFGSYSTGEQKRNSDIDILVEPTKHMGFEFFGLQIELQEKLKKKVDLVSYNGISPYLRDRILSQEVRII